MNLLTLVPLILGAIPGIIQAIEQAAAPGTNGADKKAAVINAVTQMAAAAAEIDPNDQALIKFCASLAGPAVDAVVSFYNIIHKFFHKSSPVATPAAGK